MIDYLIQLDTRLFLFLNGLNNPAFDKLIFFFTNGFVWIPLYLVFLYALWKKMGKQIWIVLVAVAVLVALTDQTSVHLFKNTFQRLRPSRNPDLQGLVHLVNGYKGGQFGFISSHAANCFGIGVLLSLFMRRAWFTCTILLWAAIMAYTRIYLGVHYPGDILCGTIWGVLLGTLVYYVARLLMKKYTPPTP